MTPAEILTDLAVMDDELTELWHLAEKILLSDDATTAERRVAKVARLWIAGMFDDLYGIQAAVRRLA